MIDTPELQPTLEGPRVVVRPLVPGDWDELFAAASDPQIWALHPAKDRHQESVFRGYFDDAVACRSAFVFVERRSQRLFGSSRYHGFDAQARELEIGWTFMTREFWGGSYNLEVKTLMLAHAFTLADTVVFWVGAENWRSRRAMEKLGAELRPGTHSRDLSGAVPHVIYEISRNAPATLR